jgi:hypothetical protein
MNTKEEKKLFDKLDQNFLKQVCVLFKILDPTGEERIEFLKNKKGKKNDTRKT